MVGPNNESEITKKIRYFTSFPENNQITNSEKIVICPENFSKTSYISWELRRLIRKSGRSAQAVVQRLIKLSIFRLILQSSCNKRHFRSDFSTKIATSDFFMKNS